MSIKQVERLRLRRAYPHIQLNDQVKLAQILLEDIRWRRAQIAKAQAAEDKETAEQHDDDDDDEDEKRLGPLV